MHAVPVFLATTRFRHDCERTQFPLVVAYAITIHKSEGMAYNREGRSKHRKKAFRPGLSYVGTSRVMIRAREG
jgi:hypothetical protein